MNVLYVSGAGDQATLLHGDQLVTAPLGSLKALATRIKAKGNTVLVLDAALQATEVPTGIPPQNLPPYLDAQHGGYVIPSAQPQPTLVQVADLALLGGIRAAAKSAGLHLTQLVPFSSAVVRAVDPQKSLVVIHQTLTTYEVTLLTLTDPPSSRSMPHSERNTLPKVAKNAASRALTRNDHPRIVVVSDEPLRDPPEDDDFTILTLQHVLQQATVPFPLGAGAHEFLAPLLASMTRNLSARAPLDKRLLAGLALAAALNGGLYAAANVVNGQVQTLSAERDSLALQATEVDALRAANEKLATRNGQARTLIENKGPLAQDLPLLVSRITELPATLGSLSGPNNATAEDTRAFGAPVERTYDLSATTTRVEALTRAYQERGLRADMRNIDCSTPRCTVTFRAAPIPLAAAPTSATPGTTTAPVLP